MAPVSPAPAAPSKSIPCPGDDIDVIKLTDKDVASYIEFPDNTFFLESMAQNPAYAPGVAYVPAQQFVNGRNESHIYEIRPGFTEAKHLFGPCVAVDDETGGYTTEVTLFGSALSTDGILYMTAFNRNSVVSYNLKDLHKESTEMGDVYPCTLEVPGVFAPNDVCLDPKDETVLYVAGGTLRDCCGCTGFFHFSNPAFGQIYKVQLDPNSGTPTVTVHVTDLRTLAGIEVIDDKIWTAQLYNIITNQRGQQHDTPEVVWKGNDGKGAVWLADNVDVFDNGNYVLVPAYNIVPESSVNRVMKDKYALSAGVMAAQLATAVMRGESIRDALLDPEVSLKFSNTFIKQGQPAQPVRLIFIPTDESDPKKAYHFEIDLCETRNRHAPRCVKCHESGQVQGERHYFHEQVTHAAHLETEDEGYIVCINFEQPRILMLKDSVFRKHLGSHGSF